jgi:uncharacterized Fe-S cluster protein YjdI
MPKSDKKYTNGEITVFWKPDTCIHSTKCFSSLINVFDPRKRPWINMQGAGTDEIIKTVNNCPSGALSYKRNNELDVEENKPYVEENTRMHMLSNGPMMVEGECVIIDKDGNENLKSGKFFLCRCGASLNKPFCDGSHKRINFEG